MGVTMMWGEGVQSEDTEETVLTPKQQLQKERREIRDTEHDYSRKGYDLERRIDSAKSKMATPLSMSVLLQLEMKEDTKTLWSFLYKVEDNDWPFGLTGGGKTNNGWKRYIPGTFTANSIAQPYKALADYSYDMHIVSRIALVGGVGTVLAAGNAFVNLIGEAAITVGIIGTGILNAFASPFRFFNGLKKRREGKKAFKVAQKELDEFTPEKEAFSKEAEKRLAKINKAIEREERIETAEKFGLPKEAIDHPKFDEFVMEAQQAENARLAAESEQKSVEDELKNLSEKTAKIYKSAEKAVLMVEQSRGRLGEVHQLREEIKLALPGATTVKPKKGTAKKGAEVGGNA